MQIAIYNQGPFADEIVPIQISSHWQLSQACCQGMQCSPSFFIHLRGGCAPEAIGHSSGQGMQETVEEDQHENSRLQFDRDA